MEITLQDYLSDSYVDEYLLGLSNSQMRQNYWFHFHKMSLNQKITVLNGEFDSIFHSYKDNLSEKFSIISKLT